MGIMLFTWGCCNLVRVCPQHKAQALSHHSCQLALRWQVGGESLEESWKGGQRSNRAVPQHSSLCELCAEWLLVYVCACMCLRLSATLKGEVYPPTHHWSSAVWGFTLGAPVHTVSDTDPYIFQGCLLFSSPTLRPTFPKLSLFILNRLTLIINIEWFLTSTHA